MILASKLDPGSEVDDALQAKPDGLDAWFAVAFACKESAQHGHQAQHFVEPRRFCWHFSVIKDVRSLPFVGFEQKRRGKSPRIPVLSSGRAGAMLAS